MPAQEIQILAENESFLVVSKPAGLSVHNNSPSLSDFLTAQKKPLHFVNRLDLETSGLMVIAQKPELHALLAKSLELGTKTYRALLRGSLESTVWNWPLTDKAEGRDNPQGKSSDRVRAESHVTVLRKNAYFTEAHIVILTGRQHQIRKHAALSRHAIVGDPRYNERQYNQRIASIYKETRMCLHAEKLAFTFQHQNFEFEEILNLEKYFATSTAHSTSSESR
jgi:23S rRNA-/tRNA-specific pseudouridylate synthase